MREPFVRASHIGPQKVLHSRREVAKAKDPGLRSRLEAAAADIHRFTLYACRDTLPGKRKTEKVQNAVTSVWDIVFKEKKR